MHSTKFLPDKINIYKLSFYMEIAYFLLKDSQSFTNDNTLNTMIESIVGEDCDFTVETYLTTVKFKIINTKNKISLFLTLNYYTFDKCFTISVELIDPNGNKNLITNFYLTGFNLKDLLISAFQKILINS